MHESTAEQLLHTVYMQLSNHQNECDDHTSSIYTGLSYAVYCTTSMIVEYSTYIHVVMQSIPPMCIT